jgi:cell division protein FtsB
VAGDLEVPQAVSRPPRLPVTPLLLTAAAIVIGYLAFTTVRYVVHDYRLRNDEAALRREITGLDTDHGRLVAVRDYLRSEEYVEYVARRILGLVRPGETLVVVSGAQPAPTAAAATPPADRERGEWWEDLFFPTPAATPGP